MSGKVDLYDGAYRNFAAEAYRQVRLETYGQDFGQTSWVTNEESAQIPRLLGVRDDSAALEIGCGSGGYAVHLAETLGCRITGIDINQAGIRNARELARTRDADSRVRFEECDVSNPLPFEADRFDAAFSNDALCHVRGRAALLSEIYRVLKPDGRLIFSDALVIGGMISHEEIATRSSIGYYVYSPPGENERLLINAGFSGIRAVDTTSSAAIIARRWHDARERQKNPLLAAEGEANFAGLQRFLDCVHTLTAERRLLRYLYFAVKLPQGKRVEA